ncbi:MAG TPA: glycoside hydrolase family 9 protein, partial [Bacteroidales bacterium]|nr:glycoside hydrolase family 9 protein [Bacteroidales bacterium]
MKLYRFLAALLLLAWVPATSFSQATKELHIDKNGVLYSRCFSVMTFQNKYYQGRRGALELVIHGERVASNGDIRLEPIPIPDAPDIPMPAFISSRVDSLSNAIYIQMDYPALGFKYQIMAQGEGENVRIRVRTEGQIPDSVVGKLAFMMEFFPGTYRGKAYFVDGKEGIFPHQFNGLRDYRNHELETVPMANGKKLSLAPDDSLHHITIEAVKGRLDLLDGRGSTNHKWFIVRSLLPGDGQGNEIEWLIKPEIHESWKSEPIVGFSQIGYQSAQPKVSVVEMDNTDSPDSIYLYRVNFNGGKDLVKAGVPVIWGPYYRKTYARFDFSEVTDEGLYFIDYRGRHTESFMISPTLYEREYWRPTLETFIPVQMCHVSVWDRMRLWHGVCHLDDALQAPPGLVHFDNYQMEEETHTRFKAFEHIPDYNVGGWHDAGDNDIESPSNTSTLYTLGLTWEEFGEKSDQTFIDEKERHVRLHEPDGIPDLIQQIDHGVDYVLACYRNFGHYTRGVICPDFEQYLQMGDAASQTDGLVYDPSLAADEVKNGRSGKKDDRLAFTNYRLSYEYEAASALAAASRALKEYNPERSQECLNTALTIWKNVSHAKEDARSSRYASYQEGRKRMLAVELYLSTGDDEFKDLILEPFDMSGRYAGYSLWSYSRVVDKLGDRKFRKRFDTALRAYEARFKEELSESPYDVLKIHSMFGTGFNFIGVARMQ